MQKGNPKKILYVITKSNFGGAQRYVFELACAMQAAGHRVAVASAPTGRLVDKLSNHKIEHLPIKSFQRNVNPLKELVAFLDLKKCYQAFQPDIVHLNSSKAGGLGSLAARLCGVKAIIFTVHGWPFLEPRSLVWRTLAWLGSFFTGLLSHQLILVSHHDFKETKMPFVKEKCSVIHTAVSTINFYDKAEARHKLFSPTQIDSHRDDLWLLTIAELHHNKNLASAIRAVATHNRTSSKQIFYCLIGEGERYTELSALINQLNTENQVVLLGYQEQARIYLKAFDVFLLPSLKEGLPYTLLEAGAAGLPVMASRVGGIPEVITDNENGLLFDPGTQKEITDALKTYTVDEDLRHEHGLRLKNKVEKQFNLTTMVEETTALYSSIIDKSGAL